MVEKNTPRETAETLLNAASNGEVLMREVESIRNSATAQGGINAVFKEMINLSNSGAAANLELVDAEGNPVTSDRQVHRLNRIIRTKPDGTKETLYDSDGDPDARVLMANDKTDVVQGAVDDSAHPEDVTKIVATFQKAVDDMVKNGQRLDGEGVIMGILNNAGRAYFNDDLKDCADQAVYVLNQLNKLNLGDRWDLNMVGAPPHYTLQAVPRSANDPIISMDPWRGRSSFAVNSGQGKQADQRLNRWMDDQWNLRWK